MLCVTPFFVLLCWLRDLSMLEPTSAIGTATVYALELSCSDALALSSNGGIAAAHVPAINYTCTYLL